MMRSGGEQLQQFEGLVLTTARMFADQVKREEHDLAQELRIRVWRAIETHDPEKCTGTLRSYVYSVVANKVKDFKRDAAREANRRHECGLTFLHIEDMQAVHNGELGRPTQEVFDGYYHFVEHDQVYGQIDNGELDLPVDVTEEERRVAMLLLLELNKTEAALVLGLARSEVDRLIASLREKLADWKPANGSQVVELPVLLTTTAELVEAA